MNIRGSNYCRGCGSDELIELLNLGNLPIANELLVTSELIAEKFPLVLSLCKICNLGQVADVVPPGRLFEDYRYLSSMSNSFLKHAANYVEGIIRRFGLRSDDWVLEIASNDGYLLKNFVELGYGCLGIEPSKNVAKLAIARGIPTLNEFFGSELAKRLLLEKGPPSLIVANNVLAHVPDLQDFIDGLAIICGVDTVITIENPSLFNIKMNMQFDSIYHEHYSYLSLTALTKLLAKKSLRIFDIDKLETHGGSIRYYLCKADSYLQSTPRITSQLKIESESGIFDSNEWGRVRDEIEGNVDTFRKFLKHEKEKGKIIWGYGAAAKASTIINFSGIEQNLISSIADSSPEKQGRFLPAIGIPIVHPDFLFESEPDHVIIFPWNIAEEITHEIRTKSKKQPRIWRLIPNLIEII